MVEGDFDRMEQNFKDIPPLLNLADHNPLIVGLVAATYRFRGSGPAARGDSQLATELFKEGLASFRTSDGQWFVACYLLTLGSCALNKGDYDKAEMYYNECLPVFREIHDVTGIACAFAGLGNMAWLQGDLERALALHRESLANFRDSRDGSSIAFCLESLNGGVRPTGGLTELVARHNERLDLSLDEWSKEIIAEVTQRSGMDADR